MDMKHRLPGPFHAVHHSAVTALVDALLARDHLCGEQKATDIVDLGFTYIVDRGDMPTRDDQNVNGRLGIGVAESKDTFVLIDNIRIDLAGDNLAKNTVRVCHDTTSLIGQQ
jgi:hypothetical protein